MTTFIELEGNQRWVNAGRITEMHYINDRIDLMCVEADASETLTVCSGLNEDRAGRMMGDIAVMFAEGRTVTQKWVDEWCQSDGAAEWARRNGGI